jgi:hypothetical protein
MDPPRRTMRSLRTPAATIPTAAPTQGMAARKAEELKLKLKDVRKYVGSHVVAM